MSASESKIAGRNIVVTGGASGIGLGLCRRFIDMGAAKVIVADLNENAAQQAASDLGDSASAVTCDVGDEASVEALVASAIERCGHIDMFVANAGVGAGAGLDASNELWELSWRVNVMGPVYAARHAIPHMAERGGGAFVITASSAGLTTGPTSFNYATSKHAAVGVAEWLAINHGPTVTVSAICPTLVDTPMAPEFGTVLKQPLTVDEVVDSAVEGIEAGQFLITPEPVAVDMLRAKAQDYDGFLANMQQRVAAMQAATERPG